ncbi:hypothetical protein Agabi119p4_4593 [Agaricus bisporus var. burnettii]|uniref:TLC domain-containing protein n=1 Tax=Agaricus bisporus var. burnettii TaxID=192524 RepID=A0A8H7F3Q6_AGABI|nr:hypothetical protein Agabi119p4_4593 [Agaricus bisporus var. burnettii]
MVFAVPLVPPLLRPFLALQYPTTAPAHPDSFPLSTYYNVGKLDICLVITLIAVMAVLRDSFRLGIFEPFARWKLTRDLERRRKQREARTPTTNGHANGSATNGHSLSNGTAKSPYSPRELKQLNRSVLRFAEQGWSVVYYSSVWSYGLYVHRCLPTRILDPVDLWLNYPHIPLAAPFKFYYLTQMAFYLHQILILNAEARRSDHVLMMSHHIITVILMWASYYTNLTRVGALIMVLMDWCDIFLPLAKMFRYIQITQLATDATFGVFLVSWFITRHILFLFVIKSTVIDAPKIIPPEWSSETGRYLSRPAHTAFSAMLLALQVMQCVWFWLICRVAWRVLSGKGAADARSDDEGSDVDEKED